MNIFFRYLLSLFVLISSVYTLRATYAHGLADSLTTDTGTICRSQSALSLLQSDVAIIRRPSWFTRAKAAKLYDVPCLERRENEEDEDESHSCSRFGSACITSIFPAAGDDDIFSGRLSMRGYHPHSNPSPERYLILQVFRI
jgi:hypothetical protein